MKDADIEKNKKIVKKVAVLTVKISDEVDGINPDEVLETKMQTNPKKHYHNYLQIHSIDLALLCCTKLSSLTQACLYKDGSLDTNPFKHGCQFAGPNN